MISQRDIGWVAGIVEGEGHIGVCHQSNGGARVQAAVRMTDFDVVRQLQTVTGLGSLYDKQAPSNIARGAKPIMTWGLSRQTELLQLLPMIWPLLGERKRAAATDVLRYIQTMGSCRARYRTKGRLLCES